MENNISTAEQLWRDTYMIKDGAEWTKNPEVVAIEVAKKFAKLHLQAQQEAILKVLENRGEHNNIDKNIIINSYPLNLIK